MMFIIRHAYLKAANRALTISNNCEFEKFIDLAINIQLEIEMTDKENEIAVRRANEKLSLAFDLGVIAARQKKQMTSNPYSMHDVKSVDNVVAEQQKVLFDKWVEGYQSYKTFPK